MGRNAVCIVDDHPIAVEAIGRAILEGGDFQILSASCAKELQSLLELNRGSQQFDIRAIFLDIRLPDANGNALIPQLRSCYEIPIIAISGTNEEELIIYQCIKNGASGFVRKSADLTTFSSALRIVLEGGLYFPAEYINGKKKISVDGAVVNLNDTQRQILDLILQGKSNKEISDELFLAEGTVKNKVSELLSLFNAKSRAQIIAEMGRLGYVPH